MADEAKQRRRRWIKLWTQETLYGTTSRELDPAERWVWCGFLALAGDSPVPGKICLAPGIPYTDQQLAAILRVPQDVLEQAREKMIRFEKIKVNAEVIEVLNWDRYQETREEYMKEYMRTWRTKRKKKEEG